MTKSSDRVRFNWGYHDGAIACRGLRATIDRNGFGVIMAKHNDKVYAHGYKSGFSAQQSGVYAENSDAAWAGRSMA